MKLNLDEERRLARERKLANRPSWDADKPISNGTLMAGSGAYVPPAMRNWPSATTPHAQPADSWDSGGDTAARERDQGRARDLGREMESPLSASAAFPLGASAPAPAQQHMPLPSWDDDDEGSDAGTGGGGGGGGGGGKPMRCDGVIAAAHGASAERAVEELGHVLEISGLPSSLPHAQLLSLAASLVQLEPDELVLVPVSARTSLLVLHSTTAASAVLHAHAARGAGSVRLMALSAGSEEARRFASTQPLPKAHRPRTTAAGASRLISSSLGIRVPADAARRAPTLAEERRKREEECARKQREKAEADALWFDD